MVEVKWIKIVTDIFSNKKIRQIESMPDCDAILVIWFKLLCLAGSVNENGLIMLTKDLAYTEEMLATEFRKPINTIRLALKTFERFGMVELIDNIYKVSNWDKYQNTGKLNEIREYNRLAKQKQRERKQLTEPVKDNVKDMSRTCQECQDTDIDKDIDIELDKDIDIESFVGSDEPPKQTKRFVKPSVDDIRSYCIERANRVTPEVFFDYYEANGWRIGKTPMKDWRAAIRTWERNGYGNGQEKKNYKTAPLPKRKYDGLTE